ncbi:MAG: hypothetical protein HYV07_00490 [Deltaproteobacteria bacterium]|nr:hypothetical protein [Deltaproteobacteria bacterium]
MRPGVLMLFASGCSPATVLVPALGEPTLVIVVDDDLVRTEVFEGDASLEIDGTGAVLLHPARRFVDSEQQPASFDGVAARRVGKMAPTDGCGECLVEPRSGTQLVHSGDACPLPGPSVGYEIPSGRALGPEDSAELAAKLVLDWPGPCACAMRDPETRRGPLRPADGFEWPLTELAVSPDGVFAAGANQLLWMGRDVVSRAASCHQPSLGGWPLGVHVRPAGDLIVEVQTSDSKRELRSYEPAGLELRWATQLPAGGGSANTVAGRGNSLSIGASEKLDVGAVGVIRLCDLADDGATCNAALVFPDLNSEPLSAVWSSSGRSLATHFSSDSGLLVVPRIPAAREIAEAANAADSDPAITLSNGDRSEVWKYPDILDIHLAQAGEAFVACRADPSDPSAFEVIRVRADRPTRPEPEVLLKCPAERCSAIFSGPANTFIVAAGSASIPFDAEGNPLRDCESGDRLPAISRVTTSSTSGFVLAHGRLMRMSSVLEPPELVYGADLDESPIEAAPYRDGFVVISRTGTIDELDVRGRRVRRSELGLRGVGAASVSPSGDILLVEPRSDGVAVWLGLPDGVGFRGERIWTAGGSSTGFFDAAWASRRHGIAILPESRVVVVDADDKSVVEVRSEEAREVIGATDAGPLARVVGNGGVAWVFSPRQGIAFEIDLTGEPPLMRRAQLHAAPGAVDAGTATAFSRGHLGGLRARCPGRALMGWADSRVFELVMRNGLEGRPVETPQPRGFGFQRPIDFWGGRSLDVLLTILRAGGGVLARGEEVFGYLDADLRLTARPEAALVYGPLGIFVAAPCDE